MNYKKMKLPKLISTHAVSCVHPSTMACGNDVVLFSIKPMEGFTKIKYWNAQLSFLDHGALNAVDALRPLMKRMESSKIQIPKLPIP
jgi:hypothetical protein